MIIITPVIDITYIDIMMLLIKTILYYMFNMMYIMLYISMYLMGIYILLFPAFMTIIPIQLVVYRGVEIYNKIYNILYNAICRH